MLKHRLRRVPGSCLARAVGRSRTARGRDTPLTPLPDALRSLTGPVRVVRIRSGYEVASGETHEVASDETSEVTSYETFEVASYETFEVASYETNGRVL